MTDLKRLTEAAARRDYALWEVEMILYPPGVPLSPIARVLWLTALEYKVTVADMKGPSREKNIVMARHVAMYLLWMSQNYTLGGIGSVLGWRTPATISHGFAQIADCIGNNRTLARKVRSIREAYEH